MKDSKSLAAAQQRLRDLTGGGPVITPLGCPDLGKKEPSAAEWAKAEAQEEYDEEQSEQGFRGE